MSAVPSATVILRIPKFGWAASRVDGTEMVVVPAGSFTRGSPANEPQRRASWEEQARVSIPAPFAVGRFAVTFDEWNACVADGGCNGY
jgi:formylglycine-generating enzyme required for sulfatase activity